MKTTIKFYYFAFALLGSTLMLFNSCNKEDVPTISTVGVTEITQTTAKSGGTITDNGGATVTALGVCWSTTENPTVNDSKTEDENGIGSFTSIITGLEPNTTYYVRAYAINSEGAGYGVEKSFTTYNSDAITDIEGNFYNIVTIGNQVWLAKNLRTTIYNNGTPIATGHTNSEWESLSTGAYAVYPYSQIVGLSTENEVLEVYGALYNWYAVNTGNLCPTGWRVPSNEDWTQLIMFVDPDATLTEFAGHFWEHSLIAGGKLKAENVWYSDCHGTDEFGFSALLGGGRDYFGSISHIGISGYWWSSTEYNSINAFYRRMYCGNNLESDYYNKGLGFSVRCVRD